jgi:erythromycin esterase-like protein
MSINDWIEREAVETDPNDPAGLDPLIGLVDDSVEMLAIGEPMHGDETFLRLRNTLFRRLVETRGYSAIAVESSYPRGRIANEFVARQRSNSYDDIRSAGFSHGFGELTANRELVEWMRSYNSDPSNETKLQFYGFDSPTEMMYSDSPRQLLTVTLDYAVSVDPAEFRPRRNRIERLVGDDAAWENTEANLDPSKSIGGSANAQTLRLELEDLIAALRIRRPELVAKSDADRYLEAEHCASAARHLLTYHAAVARQSEHRLAELLGMRDLIMADNLAYIANRERGRGRVLVFAHNSHLKRGEAQWQLGPQLLKWWPAGAQLNQIMGLRYAVIGVGVGTWEPQGVGQPEEGTLEAVLSPPAGRMKCVATHLGRHLPTDEVVALPARSGSHSNPSYFPFTPASLTDFDYLVVMN